MGSNPTRSTKGYKMEEKVKKLLELQNYFEVIKNMTLANVQVLADGMPEDMSDSDKNDTLLLAEKILSRIDLKSFEDIIIQIYTKSFTEEELDAAIEFFGSEVGASYYKKGLSIVPEVHAAMQNLIVSAVKESTSNLN